MTLRNIIPAIAGITLLGAATAGCGEDSTIGSSLLEDQVQIVVDSSFTVTGHSEAVASVRPRTIAELLGAIDIPGYGSISSSAVAQFVPAVALDTATFDSADIDSAFLNFRYLPGAFIGDSIAPMTLTVFPLTKALPADIASDFDPTGYYDPSQPLTSTVYNTSAFGSDSVMGLATRTIAMKLPLEFSKSLFDAFVANPDNFANGQIFTANVFPGIYAQSSFGRGRLTIISRTTITLHMSTIKVGEEKNDTIEAEQEYFAVAPEVINNNNIKVELDPALRAEVENGAPLMIAPAGYEVKLRFPAPEVIAAFKEGSTGLSVINDLYLSLPADTIATGYKVDVPPYALMVLSKDRDEFFAQNKLPDNKTSFYCQYDQRLRRYAFSGMVSYLKDLMDKEDELTPEDYTFTIVPVQVNFELDMTSYQQNYIVSEVVPYIAAPSVARFDFSKAKVNLTYSRQQQL